MSADHDVSFLKPVGDYGQGGVFSAQWWRGFTTDFWRWATTLDHKKIGVMYLCATLFAFFLGGVAALMLRAELFEPTITQQVTDAAGNVVTKTTGELFPGWQSTQGTVTTNNFYNRLFSLHGTLMVFLFIIPAVPAAFGNIFLPIMIGAKDVAFPRLNLMSWYIYLFGGIFAVYSLIAGGVETGWTFYTPYSTSTQWGSVTSMVLGAFILGFSSILTGMNFIVTVHKLRAPGMGWFDMPLFVWAAYATSIIQVLATPVLAITLLMIVFERTFRVGVFDPALGGDPVLFQHFFWFYSHPAVYIMIVPAFGIVSELIAVHCHKRLFGYKAIAFSSIGIAAVSFLIWGHHMFTAESPAANVIFSALTFLVGLPTAIKVFNWVATMYKASITWNTPMLYAMSFLFNFTIGGLTGPPLAVLSTDIHLHDTYFVVAHFHYVMMGGSVIAVLGALHHWWPKFTGKMYNDKAARWMAVLVFVGFNITFFTQFFLGTHGMPRRYATYVPEFTHLHQISTIGSWVLAVGLFGHLLIFAQSLVGGRPAGRNPWGGLTLEWYTDSPPIEHNFPHEPMLTHGPYDYDLVVPPGWDPADYPLPDPETVRKAHGH
ncbi:MAG: cbb3-type cytochrome c oxidase subunit I [Phycisphaerales bacterium]|nr:cbb3-type cytochrome c oxidase subunit I [Phycisphaerales bacterium]